MSDVIGILHPIDVDIKHRSDIQTYIQLNINFL